MAARASSSVRSSPPALTRCPVAPPPGHGREGAESRAGHGGRGRSPDCSGGVRGRFLVRGRAPGPLGRAGSVSPGVPERRAAQAPLVFRECSRGGLPSGPVRPAGIAVVGMALARGRRRRMFVGWRVSGLPHRNGPVRRRRLRRSLLPSRSPVARSRCAGSAGPACAVARRAWGRFPTRGDRSRSRGFPGTVRGRWGGSARRSPSRTVLRCSSAVLPQRSLAVSAGRRRGGGGRQARGACWPVRRPLRPPPGIRPCDAPGCGACRRGVVGGDGGRPSAGSPAGSAADHFPCVMASPMRCTRRELVEPGVPGGLPATMTIVSPFW